MTILSKLSKLFENKHSRLFISLLLAVLLWMYSSSMQEDIQQSTYRGIPVVFTGEDSIRQSRGLIISGVDTTSVSVKITGNRRALNKINRSEIKANINVAQVTQAGEMRWVYELTFPSGVDTSSFTYEYTPETISFTVEKEASKTVPVEGRFEGSAAEGFVANNDTLTFEPAMITVYGTETELAQIDRALVVLSGENVSSTITENLPYVFVDEDNNEVKPTHVSTDVETVTTTLSVNTIKKIAIALDVIYGGGASESNCEITMDVTEIQLSGDADELALMEKLTVGTIDLSDYEDDVELTFPIVLADGVQCLTGETEVKVKVKFKDLSIKEFEVTNFEYTNLTKGYKADVVTNKLMVKVRAPEETLSKLAAADIRVVADLTDYTTASGYVKVPCKVYIDGVTGAGAVGDYILTINLTT